MKNLLHKIVGFLEKLSSKPKVDGLEISDGSLAYVYFEGDTPKTAAVRLAPGVVKNGKLEDKAAFTEALRALHRAVSPDAENKVLKVNCVLPSGALYTQSFEVPNVGEEKLPETVGLNLQMISPIAAGEANMSAQIIGETPDRYELLGAFAETAAIAAFKETLTSANFMPVVFESSSLALARLIVASIKIGDQPVLVLHLKSDGMDLAILRDGHLHFNYFRSWQSIQGDTRTISRELFDGAVLEEVRKVVNFAVSRWGEGPAGVLLVAPNFEAEISKLLATNFNLKAVPFVLPAGGLTPNFYAALGGAARGRQKTNDGPFAEINVGGEDSFRAMSWDQVLGFIGLWRNIIAGVLAVMLLAFIFSASFLVSQANSLVSQASDFKPPLDQQTLTNLTSKAQSFNALVAGVAAAKQGAVPWYAILNYLVNLAQKNRIIISDVDIASFTAPVQLAASAPDYATLLQFKNALSADPNFGNVNLPLTQVTTLGTGNVSFNVSFNFTPAAMSLR
jgi:hypothetical protein